MSSPGSAPVARMKRQSTPSPSSEYATTTASTKPPYHAAWRLDSRKPRPFEGTNSASIVCPMAYSAPIASPSSKRSTRSIHTFTTTIWSAPNSTKPARSTMKIVRLPYRSVRAPKIGPPKKMPMRLDAAISPCQSAPSPNSLAMSGRTTLMDPRS